MAFFILTMQLETLLGQVDSEHLYLLFFDTISHGLRRSCFLLM
uniref:Uncharacterized protein n=1 Tax=Candidatus Kentrum sp. UNK TaxID=2126344 RepID=A0A451B4B7_9GAMM|nr:MAG: hypothetical protein BECKUNK1418G_GA0071005_11662 [Candidatus Kentron sp. UNK]VFK73123.1 MAG: hypothetical protein BECKUNK1418H_GA0071006_11652 [Candidatus Kentron sp. UNK]